MMKYMHTNGIKLSAVLVALGLAACSGSGTSPKGVTTANVSSNTLQFNVGTANLGVTGGPNITGTNVVVTYRQPSGQSGTLVICQGGDSRIELQGQQLAEIDRKGFGSHDSVVTRSI